MYSTQRHVVRTAQPLTDAQLQTYAPSVFATRPWDAMSDKYTFIPTINIVNKMRSEGFQPFAAAQSRTRIPGKSDFTKHMLRFRDMRGQAGAPVMRELGTIYPELVLTNSHDGASAYILDAGLFRLVCTNGMVVSEGNFNQVRTKHLGSADDIIEASYSVVEEFPKVLESVTSFSQKLLTTPQQTAFAQSALMLRYDENERAPISAQQLVRPQRIEDSKPTLWNTFNTVQEHLTQGGIRYRNPATLRRGRTRAISSIGEDTKLNRALWALTEEMNRLVAS